MNFFFFIVKKQSIKIKYWGPTHPSSFQPSSFFSFSVFIKFFFPPHSLVERLKAMLRIHLVLALLRLLSKWEQTSSSWDAGVWANCGGRSWDLSVIMCFTMLMFPYWFANDLNKRSIIKSEVDDSFNLSL